MYSHHSDTAWKEILDDFFKDCLDYCLPNLSRLIDWSKKWITLDKELFAITKSHQHGKRLVDKLFSVYLYDGSEQWVLIHLEIQASYDHAFAKRMFTYGYRIYDKYQRPIVSCAILTDTNKKWRPNYYEIGLAGSYLRGEFLLVKLIDYDEQRHILEGEVNPFASVILTQLAVLEARKRTDNERRDLKYLLTKRLYEKGFRRKEIMKLYKFIDWLISLPEIHELEYMHAVTELEEMKNMRYITSAERLGYKRGIEQGIEQGKQEVAEHLLSLKADIQLIAKATGLPLAKIKQLKKDLH